MTPQSGPPSIHALEALFRTERKSILHYLRRRVGPDEAPDLLQEIFARAFSSEQANRLANPAAFVRRITRNLLIDRARRRKRAEPFTFFEFDEKEHLISGPEQSWALDAVTTMRTYGQILERLPDRTRRIFQMHRQQGLTRRQIADETGLSVMGVEYHMGRALAALRLGLRD